jgi:uncharacterized protein YjbI with pentapeptide repeats
MLDARQSRRVELKPGHFCVLLLLVVSCEGSYIPVCHAQVYSHDFEGGPWVPKDFEPGPGVDASHMNLEGSFFGGFNLNGASFEGANLRGARFAQNTFYHGELASLTPVSFKGADLRNTIWEDYDDGLQKADFTNARIEGMIHMPGASSHFLTPEQIRSTMSYKIKNLSGFHWLGGALSGNATPPPGEAWTRIGNRGFNRRVDLDLRGFDLRRTRFSAGDFTHSKFDSAYIRGVTFSGVKITHAQIASTASWRGGVLDNNTADTPLALSMAYLDCSGWDFSRKNLCGSSFKSVDLTDASFREANLRDVVFQVSKCERADFSGSDLRGASIAPARTDNPDCIRDSDIRGARLGMVTREQLESTTSYRMGDLSGTTFHISLAGVDLSRQVLVGCGFVGCDITGTDFTDAVITGCEFRVFKPEDLPSAHQIRSTWNYKHKRMDGIACFRWDSGNSEFARDEQWPRNVLEDAPFTNPESPSE